MIARAKRITLKSKTTSGSNKKAKQKTRKGKTTKNQKKENKIQRGTIFIWKSQ